MVRNVRICAAPRPLTPKARRALPAWAFALPSKRKYPLFQQVAKDTFAPSRSHALSALGYANRWRGRLTSDEYTKIVSRARAVLRDCEKEVAFEVQRDANPTDLAVALRALDRDLARYASKHPSSARSVLCLRRAVAEAGRCSADDVALAVHRNAADAARQDPRHRNPLERAHSEAAALHLRGLGRRRRDNGPRLNAALGALAGGLVGNAVGFASGSLLVSYLLGVAGASVGAYAVSPPARRSRATAGAAIGGAILAAPGATIGAAIA